MYVSGLPSGSEACTLNDSEFPPTAPSEVKGLTELTIGAKAFFWKYKTTQASTSGIVTVMVPALRVNGSVCAPVKSGLRKMTSSTACEPTCTCTWMFVFV